MTPKSRNRLLAIDGVGRFKPIKPGCIHIRCGRCKLTRSNIPRTAFDPENAAVLVISPCPRCDKGGEFEDGHYYDLNGKEIQL